MRVFALLVVATLLCGCRVRRIEPDAAVGPADEAPFQEGGPPTGTDAGAAEVLLEDDVQLLAEGATAAVLVVSGAAPEVSPAGLLPALAASAHGWERGLPAPEQAATQTMGRLEIADVAHMVSAAPLRANGERWFDAVVATSPLHWGSVAAAPEVARASFAAMHAFQQGALMLVGEQAAFSQRGPGLPVLPPPTTAQPGSPLDAAAPWRAYGWTSPLSPPRAEPQTPAVFYPPTAPRRPSFVLARDGAGRFAVVGSFGGAKDARPGQGSHLVWPGMVAWVAERGVVVLSAPQGREPTLDARDVYAQLVSLGSARAAAAWAGPRVTATTGVWVMDAGNIAQVGTETAWALWTPAGLERRKECPAP